VTDPISFIHALRFADLPPDVVAQVKRCLLDLIGVAVSGRQTKLSRIVHDFAASQMGASTGGARLMFDGRRVSVTGAAYAGASTIDAFDAHDGHRLTKGHAGVALLPALLAFADQHKLTDGREFITCLVMGYEIATRAGMALHATARDYHTSGAWNALGCAAIGARLLRLDVERTCHALGTAEYHGPRSQMMRCIDHPTMVKDGSGFGALAGVSAACLAAEGFTGAPALLIEGEAEAPFWRDLGARWEITRHYLKPYPVCRWAQPAMDATADLIGRHKIDPHDIASIEIRSFAAAVRLGTRPPCTTEEAQYALGFPVAAIAARGVLGAAELGDAGLQDPAINAMLARIRAVEDGAMTARFPAQRLAAVDITLRDGRRLASPPTVARGDPEHALADAEVLAKFRGLAALLGPERMALIERCVFSLDTDADASRQLGEAILAPI
jgi:2-methylcitrate dehydratase PrpD